MLDIIKTKRLKGYDVTLVYFKTMKGYEVQVSKSPYDKIDDTDGMYINKKEGLKAYNRMIKEIKECKVCGNNKETKWLIFKHIEDKQKTKVFSVISKCDESQIGAAQRIKRIGHGSNQ